MKQVDCNEGIRRKEGKHADPKIKLQKIEVEDMVELDNSCKKRLVRTARGSQGDFKSISTKPVTPKLKLKQRSQNNKAVSQSVTKLGKKLVSKMTSLPLTRNESRLHNRTTVVGTGVKDSALAIKNRASHIQLVTLESIVNQQRRKMQKEKMRKFRES